jgi:hypothetical protein
VRDLLLRGRLDLDAVKLPIDLKCRPGALLPKYRPRPDTFTRGEVDALTWAQRSVCESAGDTWARRGQSCADSLRIQFPWMTDLKLALVALYFGETMRISHHSDHPDWGPLHYSALYRATPPSSLPGAGMTGVPAADASNAAELERGPCSWARRRPACQAGMLSLTGSLLGRSATQGGR